MTQKLKPCPFCRWKNADVYFNEKLKAYRVQCQNVKCMASGPVELTVQNAKDAWNRRAEEE